MAPGQGSRPEEGPGRLGLLEQLVADGVASDYQSPPGARKGPAPAGPGRARPPAGSRRQRVLVGAAALALAGFVLAVGFSSRVLSAPAIQGQRAALLARIESGENDQDTMVAALRDLRAEVESARGADLQLTESGRLLAASIRELELATGYVEVTGPGAVVTLTDAPTPDPALEGDPDEEGLTNVLDADVQRAVNGLWTAGAEAVAINGRRLSARSAIRSAAGAILVDYRPLRPPYRVEAVGPPELAQRFAATQDAASLRGVAAEFGIGFATDSAAELRIPAATSALPERAVAVDDGEDGQR
jgi:uncharacterized protein YlxW (UPF0749 family)